MTTSTVAPAAAPLTIRRQPAAPLVLLVASFGAFLAFLDSTIVNVAFPDIAASFPGTSIGALSWVLTSYNIVFAAFLVVAGRLADLLGRRRAFIVGVAVFTIASGLCAVATSVEALVAYRVLQGIGAAILVPASLALVVEGYGAERRAHGVGLWGAAAAVASGLGAPVGGALVEAADWRLTFLINIPLGLIAMVLARRCLVESRVAGRRRTPDLRGAVLLAAALGLLTLGLVQGPEWGWSDPVVLGSFVAAAATGIGFVLSSRSHPAPVLDLALLRIPSFAVGTALTVVAGVGFYAYLLTHILFLSTVWGYSLLEAGLAVAPSAFVAAIVAAVLGRVADARGHRVIVVMGALVWAAGLLWYTRQVGDTPAFAAEWLPGQVLQGIGVGATMPVLGSAALASVPGGGYATASAAVGSARQLGAVLGVSGMVILLGIPDNPDALRDGWLLAAVCFAIVAVGAMLFDPGRTTEPDAAAVAHPPDGVPTPTDGGPAAAGDSGPAAGGDTLSNLRLFRGLDSTTLGRLRERAEPVELEAGRWLFRAGDRADALYVVESGRLQVRQGDVVISELGRGAVLGEVGLLADTPRSASVLALRDTALTRLSRSEFAGVADAEVLGGLARNLATRLQEVAPPSSARSARNAVVAVVALDAAAPVREVSAALLRHVQHWRRAVDPGRVDRDGLDHAERGVDTVLLTAPAGSAGFIGTTGAESDPDWQAFCLRVADRVVAVTGDPAPPPYALPERMFGADLVLAGRYPTRDQRRAWEERLAPRSSHPLDGRDPTVAMRPLGARLAGRSLGLVLGGGGARGFAHLGVLDELEAAGIPVDRVAGTSMGAVIGGAVACGMDAAAVDAHAYEHFVRVNPIGDYTLPRTGLLRGRRTATGLQAVFGDRIIEELPLEFRCVSTDLLRRRPVVHRRGSLADAVGASLRLPGLYSPLLLGDTLHVDGGVLDNLPVAALAGPEGPVVAVSISFGGSSGDHPDGNGPPRIPSLGDTMMRTMMLASGPETDRAVAMADVVLHPDSGGVGLLEFHQIDPMREAGRVVARAALPQIAALLR